LVEAALLLAYTIKVPEDTYTDLGCQLLGEDWHTQHENLIGNLQEIADPQTIPAIKRAIDLKTSLLYLEYDDYGSYYKKCLWALQAIGTPEAISAIEDCTYSRDSLLRDQALHRLSKIKPAV
jgi:HEAT repeat protein